jgi:brefeldin A-resistance guanine nucleotide exchange factor 1
MNAGGKDSAKPKITRDRSTTSLGTSAFESCLENGVRIVKGEIHNVLSIMRLNRRYNSSTRFLREIPATAESPLVRGLKVLHESLASYTDLKDFDTMLWLRPFLDVIESAETSGPITGVALSSLSKFLLYGFIHPNSPRVAEAVNTIAHVVTRCRFERTDHSGDEVVLMRILQVRAQTTSWLAVPSVGPLR